MTSDKEQSPRLHMLSLLVFFLYFARNWRIEDVEAVLGRFRARFGLAEDPSDIIAGEASSVSVRQHNWFTRCQTLFLLK